VVIIKTRKNLTAAFQLGTPIGLTGLGV